ncbi:uncharacterized protein LOC126837516 isoform X2 [Adelges cooleyi]|uniref:uncharacterized protein LOC126837516 isoform X2 n=1 Tax=Adelges cooleyi TaxID=133065 RepID=UPI00218069B8|nr:uncharacterized protein LOC126837516 isoform X2 [Adelges cooleyi]
MHGFLYGLVFTLCVCWNSVNGSPTVSKHMVPPFVAIPSGRYDGNNFSKLGNVQPSVAKPIVMTRPDRTGYGGILLNNDFGKKVTIKTKLNAKKSMAEFDEANENEIIDNHDVSIDTMTFYYTRKNAFAISLAIVQIEGLRAFLEIFQQFFVTRYLYYVKRLTAQTKLTALISYMDRFSENVEDIIRDLELSPEKTVNDINELTTEFAMALLLDLKVDDPQEWNDGVKKEIGKSVNISLAMELNKKKALAIIALCVKPLNPDWPNVRYRDPNEFLTATKLAHRITHTEEYDSEDDNIYL